MGSAAGGGCHVQRALAFIEEHLDDRLTLPAIAESLGINSYHFAHIFKRSIGVAPHHYVICRRMERAKALLADTDLPIADIALVVGCANQSHFSALFHRIAGITPQAYRAAHCARIRYTPSRAVASVIGARRPACRSV